MAPDSPHDPPIQLGEQFPDMRLAVVVRVASMKKDTGD
jgi:hypothetical protein